MIINQLKKNRIIRKIYIKLYNEFRIILTRISPHLSTYYIYKKNVGVIPNLNNPVTLTEKLQWLKLNLYYHNEKVTQCIDKYLVRNFVLNKGCGEILNELYGVWDNVEDIPWDELPNKFVLKCNHGCGYNIICENKQELDINKTKHQINKWLKQKYGLSTAEVIYSDIVPKVICEKYIEPSDKKGLKDYKIFCSYGEPKLVYVITGGHGNEECLDYYTTEWKWIPVNNGTLPNAGNNVEKPKKLNEMLLYAKKLSKDFPIVRVDLYYENEQIYFGELTFLATGGMSKFNPREYDKIFGEMFDIEKEIKEKGKNKNVKF